MSSIGSSALRPGEVRLARFIIETLGSDFELVDVTIVGRKVILQGTAPSFAAKIRAGQCLSRAGYAEVENCLRVIPGIPSMPAGTGS